MRAQAVLFTLAAACASAAPAQRCFPDDFLFGSATASYQVEGGWNATGRTPSIWDDFCRAQPNLECANVADDFVHRYKADIELMAETGLSSFRFSVSWSRAMNWDAATGRMKPNAPGIAFYHDVIDALRAKNIVPILTLYHWDLPHELHTQLSPPGWLNRELIDHFTEYAELMFTEFGSKVDFWSTFNEPHSFTTAGYGTGMSAPGLSNSATNEYTVAHIVLLSHARAVERFRQLKAQNVIHSKAQIGIVLNADYSYPLDKKNPKDIAAAERKMEFFLGWYLRPIVSGDYPAVMRERAGDRLPKFTADEVALVKGSYDLLMLNHYGSKDVVDCASPDSVVPCETLPLGWAADVGVDDTRRPIGARPPSTGPNGEYLCVWYSAYPKGYLDTIRWMHRVDSKSSILLTENGWCGNSTIDNQDQLWYYQRYTEQVHKALTEDKIPIVGYTAWSFVDNYEWGSFKPRFGLFYVNFTSQTGSKEGYDPKPSDLARIPRPAATWYASLAKTKCMDVLPEDVVLQKGTEEAASSSFVVTLVFLAAVAVIGVVVVRRRGSQTPEESTPLLN